MKNVFHCLTDGRGGAGTFFYLDFNNSNSLASSLTEQNDDSVVCDAFVGLIGTAQLAVQLVINVACHVLTLR